LTGITIRSETLRNALANGKMGPVDKCPSTASTGSRNSEPEIPLISVSGPAVAKAPSIEARKEVANSAGIAPRTMTDPCSRSSAFCQCPCSFCFLVQRPKVLFSRTAHHNVLSGCFRRNKSGSLSRLACTLVDYPEILPARIGRIAQPFDCSKNVAGR